jgi:iron complex transport system ATP-binding protein
VITSSLAATGVHVRHGGADRDSLRDVSFDIVRGEILVLVGPNGSGKSTLLAALGRALMPRLGTVRLSGQSARAMGPRRFARQVARLAQFPACPDGATVEELVSGGRHAHRRLLAGPSAADVAAVRDALRTVDLLDLRRRKIETLSGGERRRAWLAMALAQHAPILLLDEPTAGLDLRQQCEVLELLSDLNRRRGVTIVAVLHDLEQAAALAHRVAIVHRGRLYAVGPPDACVTPESLRDVFGIEAQVVRDAHGLRVRILGPARPLRHL